MVKFLGAIVLSLMMLFPLSVSAEKLSCQDLVDVANALDDVRDAFNSSEEIKEGDATDQALGLVIDALNEIAEAERERGLDRAVSKLVEAYNAMDGDAFDIALKRVTEELDRLYARDCN